MSEIARSFTTHLLRTTVSLDGLWDFTPASAEGDPTAAQPPQEYASRLPVPGCWETARGYEHYRGRAWYRRRFRNNACAAVRLIFHGVSHTAWVSVDGKYVGTHYGSYTKFSLLLPGLPAGEHELAVLVDNGFHAENRLHLSYYDWYIHGGIIRPVVMEELAETYLKRVAVTTTALGDPATVNVQIEAESLAAQAVSSTVEIAVTHQGETVANTTTELAWEGSVGRGSCVLSIANPKLWSPEDPQLYTIQAKLGNDDLIDRFGVRTVAVQGRELLLNGKPVQLRGFNRHDWHPDWASAVPGALQWRDLDIITGAGANFIRGSHYPNSDLFLDYCDERGVMFWEEATSWQLKAEQLVDPVLQEQYLTCITEMVEAHYNHPCIIMWGMLNECQSESPDAVPAYRRFTERFRELDSTRPITFASNKALRDVCLDLVDIVSFNQYVGWYGDGPEDWPRWLDKLEAWLKEIGQDGKPIIMSEFGAGAVPGVRSFERQKWSEDYQAELLDKALPVFLERPGVVGTAIWQFCDCRTADERWSVRPRNYNNKGIVDEYRRPKLAYDVVRKWYQAKSNAGK